MKEQKIFNFIIAFMMLFLIFYKTENSPPEYTTKIIVRIVQKENVSYDLNISNIKRELNKNNVLHSDIVLKQIMHETGHLKSNACVNGNNLFGLYSTKYKRYMRFNHWTESIVKYKECIQNRYKGGNYYRFLKRIRYARDRNYINKIKKININEKKR